MALTTPSRSEVGSRFDGAVALSPTTLLALRAKLAWAHDWVSDPSLTAAFQALPADWRIAALRTAKVDVRQATDGAYVRGFNNERPAIDEVPTPPSANC